MPDIDTRPAFPQYLDASKHFMLSATGMTIREFAAIKIMAGLASEPSWENPATLARLAVRCADALLAALAAPKETK